MDPWTIILMLGASAIWATMLVAVAWRVRLGEAESRMRAEGLEPPRAVKPGGT